MKYDVTLICFTFVFLIQSRTKKRIIENNDLFRKSFIHFEVFFILKFIMHALSV